MKVLVRSFLFMFVIVVNGQAIEEPPEKNQPSSLTGIAVTGHVYPVSAIGDVHKSFMVQYGVTKSLQLELQGFYDTYILSERFRSSLMVKYYLNKRLYLLSGLDAEIATENSEVGQAPYRLGFVAGMGYDVTENSMLEIKSSIQLNETGIGAFGETQIEMPSVYTIGSKWKF
ncbi:hypothetical protein [Maribacter dokdonensis]|uniref:hypothetical protein n=1 Tax=Maribacter dokdonensis TaxID=320912 RepID=UPI001C08AB41|nr:hypothetical protein [Maribacter dokdonensis]MBU2902841.1 hypothetical protein [Maribacter dokdonensis]